MSSLAFLFFRVERILCDHTGARPHCANRGVNVALHLLLYEVPGMLMYFFENKDATLKVI